MDFFEKIWTNLEELKIIEEKIKNKINCDNLSFKEKNKSEIELKMIEEIISHWKFYGEI